MNIAWCSRITLIFFVFFNWSIVDLQCCVNYCCTAKWFSLYIYIYTHYFLYFFAIIVYHIILNIILMLYNRTLLFIHSLYKSLHKITIIFFSLFKLYLFSKLSSFLPGTGKITMNKTEQILSFMKHAFWWVKSEGRPKK